VAKKAAAKQVIKQVAKPKVAKKAVQKKPAAAKKVANKKAVANKAASRKKPSARAGKTLTAQQRHELIAQAAYLRSEAQGFIGDANMDWIAAEAEVDGRLATAGIRVKK
jgi:hypothetical protein